MTHVFRGVDGMAKRGFERDVPQLHASRLRQRHRSRARRAAWSTPARRRDDAARREDRILAALVGGLVVLALLLLLPRTEASTLARAGLAPTPPSLRGREVPTPVAVPPTRTGTGSRPVHELSWRRRAASRPLERPR